MFVLLQDMYYYSCHSWGTRCLEEKIVGQVVSYKFL